MTHPDSSPSPDYDIHELFREELGSQATGTEDVVESTDSLQDEDRLYTDEFMRQNERASRFLMLSVVVAGLISLGVGGWYLFARNPSQSPQNEPLQVPTQPLPSPWPGLNSNSPTLPTNPGNTGQKLPPTDSGIVPDILPNGNPTLPTQIAPNSPGNTFTPPPSPPDSLQ